MNVIDVLRLYVAYVIMFCVALISCSGVEPDVRHLPEPTQHELNILCIGNS